MQSCTVNSNVGCSQQLFHVISFNIGLLMMIQATKKKRAGEMRSVKQRQKESWIKYSILLENYNYINAHSSTSNYKRRRKQLGAICGISLLPQNHAHGPKCENHRKRNHKLCT
jgi:hypothetical protein